MSIPPKLREALKDSRDRLIAAADAHLDHPQHYCRMKARFMLNVAIPFNDWFEDEANMGDMAKVAQCASEGFGLMISLLASTAGDHKMDEHASLILSVIMKEIANHLTNSTE